MMSSFLTFSDKRDDKRFGFFLPEGTSEKLCHHHLSLDLPPMFNNMRQNFCFVGLSREQQKMRKHFLRRVPLERRRRRSKRFERESLVGEKGPRQKDLFFHSQKLPHICLSSFCALVQLEDFFESVCVSLSSFSLFPPFLLPHASFSLPSFSFSPFLSLPSFYLSLS